MIRSLSAILAALCLCLTASVAEARSVASINTEWRVKREDIKGAEAPAFDDTKWQVASLPHTFNLSDGDDGAVTAGPSFYRGTAWYRKTLDMRAVPANERLYLQFDGAALVADLFVNGVFVGRHEGGFTTFRFDITRHIKTGKNVLAVRVNNAAWPHVAPLAGDYTFCGGITRGVSLIQTRDAGFDWLDHGSPAVAVSTSNVSERNADLSMAVAVRNSRSRGSKLIVQTRIFSADGKQVFSASKPVNLKANEAGRVVIAGKLPNPHLWNGVADPYIYSVVTEVTDDSATLDRTVTAFGVRSVVFDAQKGLLLNGKPYAVHGVNLHASRAGKGGAISDLDIVEDFDLMAEMGANAVRLVHYPHAQTAYDEADRRGFLVLTEVPVNGTVVDTEAFRANAALQMRELIRQNINHPSIIAWGLGNEVHGTEPFVAATLKGLNAVAEAEDRSRPTIYAHCCQADDAPLAQTSDLIGFNRYFGWYKDEFADMGKWADAYHAKFPTKPFAVLEYGAGGSVRHQESPPARVDPPSGWHPEPYQALYHEANWAQLKARPFIWGAFVWQMFDAASDGRNEGDHSGINDKGLVTYDRRTKKDAFWFYKAQWSAEPVVYITSRRFDERTKAATDVKIYTNQPQVTLKVNGVTIATQTAAGGIVVFKNITLSPGLNQIAAESPYKGQVVRDRVRWNLQAPVGALAQPDRR
ncbi:glycoside hydrolase family 2 TIM barrel-domain containing protein [Asticcacaulis sp. BYS171W]|uniref:Glycoside hydrolase family 2 TIM barrel-domain containing protein n=1 Tax=Asticcacaulis aquaticus TaxID=2984212 RepID=A0ABT5HRZ4_9CAUL|nr:glycoside hydrolase family 2 TIM barrel-domain containing protein [Asticcacaulis aquaticus]MDC7682840.1 glycoside hydrolase family 2 TIM barrel-domain containing protein [Asticcacaulis aquaticus]